MHIRYMYICIYVCAYVYIRICTFYICTCVYIGTHILSKSPFGFKKSKTSTVTCWRVNHNNFPLWLLLRGCDIFSVTKDERNFQTNKNIIRNSYPCIYKKFNRYKPQVSFFLFFQCHRLQLSHTPLSIRLCDDPSFKHIQKTSRRTTIHSCWNVGSLRSRYLTRIS